MASMHGVPFEKTPSVRLGLIGCGGRGLGLLNELLAVDGVEIVVVADLQESSTLRAAEMTGKTHLRKPITLHGSEAWKRVMDLDLDIVYIATPWETHTPYAVAAMQAGKHTAVEVPAAITLEGCWQLVETSESTQRHCVMLENCCYDYWEMLVKNMVRSGLLGTIVHAECAYLHDLRSMLLEDSSEGLWRRLPQQERDGNQYPTHGLGPVAQILEIGIHDRFETLVSMSSRSASLAEYRDLHLPENDPKRQETYRCGDMNSSLIRTQQGRTILLQFSTVLPRPYDRNFMISGTKGIFRDYPPRLFIDGHSQGEEWLPLEPYKAAAEDAEEYFRYFRYEDPLWKDLGEIARQGGGHGGMDFIMNYRLVQTLRQGLPPDSDVYDAADWSAPGPLSELSISRQSQPVQFPDFRMNQSI
jgi:predicted dehydrogenase